MPDVPLPEQLRDYSEIIETYSEAEYVKPAIREILKYRLKEAPPAFERVFQVSLSMQPFFPFNFCLFKTTLFSFSTFNAQKFFQVETCKFPSSIFYQKLSKKAAKLTKIR